MLIVVVIVIVNVIVKKGLVKRLSGVEVDRRRRRASVRKRPSSDKLNTPKTSHTSLTSRTQSGQKSIHKQSTKCLKTEQLAPALKVGQRVNWIELRGSSGMGGGPLL